MGSTGLGQLQPEPSGRVERTEGLAQEREPDGPIDRTTASLGLWPWAQLAMQNGISVERFCELAEIEVSTLRDPGARFSQPIANRVAEIAYTHVGPGAAMLAALTVEAGHFNLLELIARTAPTVKDGLETGCQFFPLLHHGGYLRHEPRADGAVVLRWQPPQSYAVHHGYIELTFAVAVLGIRRETGRDTIAPDEIHFRHAAPDDPALHTRVLGVAPRFGMAEDLVIFGPAFVALPLTRDNAAVHHAAKRAGEDLLDE
jgi:hypothetical protein